MKPLCKICGQEAYHPLHIPGQRKNHEFEPRTEAMTTPSPAALRAARELKRLHDDNVPVPDDIDEGLVWLARQIDDATGLPLLLKALARIAGWEMPATGRTWDDGTPMSYSACFGSNVERDVIRAIALEALAATEKEPA